MTRISNFVLGIVCLLFFSSSLFGCGMALGIAELALDVAAIATKPKSKEEEKKDAIERITELLKKQGHEVQFLGIKREVPMNAKYTAINWACNLKQDGTDSFKPAGIQAMFRTKDDGWIYTGGCFYFKWDDENYSHISKYDDRYEIAKYYKNCDVDVGLIDETFVRDEKPKQKLSGRMWDPGKKKYYRRDENGNRVYE